MACNCSTPCASSNSCSNCSQTCTSTTKSECVIYNGGDYSCLSVLDSSNLNDVLTIIFNNLCNINTVTWSTLTLNGGTSTANQAGFQTGQYTKDSRGWVELRGTLQTTPSSGDSLLATLPSGFRPQANLSFNGSCVYSGAKEPCYLTIATNGEITIKSGAGSNAITVISLTGLRFNVN